MTEGPSFYLLILYEKPVKQRSGILKSALWISTVSATYCATQSAARASFLKAFSCSQIWWIRYNHDCQIPISPIGCFPVLINFRAVFQLNLAVYKLFWASCKVELSVQTVWVKYQKSKLEHIADLEELPANIDGMVVMDYGTIILTAFPYFNFHNAI